MAAKFPEQFTEIKKTPAIKVLESIIDPAIILLTYAMHENTGNAIHPGEQYTIPVNMACGFSARIILQVESGGTCALKPDDEDDDPIFCHVLHQGVLHTTLDIRRYKGRYVVLNLRTQQVIGGGFETLAEAKAYTDGWVAQYIARLEQT